MLRCGENPAAIGHAFNIGNPQGTATNFELANMIIRLTNSKSEIVFKPHPGPEVELRVPAIEKAMTLLGYRPTVSLGIRRVAGHRVVSRELRCRRRQEVTSLRQHEVIVTGASGFIGHNVLLRAPREWDIVAVYHATPRTRAVRRSAQGSRTCGR